MFSIDGAKQDKQNGMDQHWIEPNLENGKQNSRSVKYQPAVTKENIATPEVLKYQTPDLEVTADQGTEFHTADCDANDITIATPEIETINAGQEEVGLKRDNYNLGSVPEIIWFYAIMMLLFKGNSW